MVRDLKLTSVSFAALGTERPTWGGVMVACPSIMKQQHTPSSFWGYNTKNTYFVFCLFEIDASTRVFALLRPGHGGQTIAAACVVAQPLFSCCIINVLLVYISMATLVAKDHEQNAGNKMLFILHNHILSSPANTTPLSLHTPSCTRHHGHRQPLPRLWWCHHVHLWLFLYEVYYCQEPTHIHHLHTFYVHHVYSCIYVHTCTYLCHPITGFMYAVYKGCHELYLDSPGCTTTVTWTHMGLLGYRPYKRGCWVTV